MEIIFGSIEAEAWCRDFDYQDYLNIHKKDCKASDPISEKTYRMLCAAFENQIDEDMEKVP